MTSWIKKSLIIFEHKLFQSNAEKKSSVHETASNVHDY